MCEGCRQVCVRGVVRCVREVSSGVCGWCRQVCEGCVVRCVRVCVCGESVEEMWRKGEGKVNISWNKRCYSVQ